MMVINTKKILKTICIFIILNIFFLINGCSPNLTNISKRVQNSLAFQKEKFNGNGKNDIKSIVNTINYYGKRYSIAVGEIADKTGANRPSQDFPDPSRAVSQAGSEMLEHILKQPQYLSLYEVHDRRNISLLLNERRIAQEFNSKTKTTFLNNNKELGKLLGEVNINQTTLEPLKPVDFYITGAIIGYDSEVSSAGGGVKVGGIGGYKVQRADSIFIILRLVDVKSGTIILSKTAERTVLGTENRADIFRFISQNTILEFETGEVRNDLVTLAILDAMSEAVQKISKHLVEKPIWKNFF